MVMPDRNWMLSGAEAYRYAYNGMEQDNEVSGNGNSYTTEFRQYDPRLGRWKSLDPLMAQFPWQSPYCAFDNNPIFYIDPSGLASEGWVRGGTNSKGEKVADNQFHWRDDINSLEEAKAIGGNAFTDGITDNVWTSTDGREVTFGPGGKNDWHADTYKIVENESVEDIEEYFEPMDMRGTGIVSDLNHKTVPDGPITCEYCGMFIIANSPDDWKELEKAWGDGWEEFAAIINDGVWIMLSFAGGEAIIGLGAVSNTARTASAVGNTGKTSTSVVNTLQITKHGAGQMVKRGVTPKMVSKAIEKGAKFYDPKNGTINYVLKNGFASGKDLLVGTNPLTGSVTTVIRSSKNLANKRFIPL